MMSHRRKSVSLLGGHTSARSYLPDLDLDDADYFHESALLRRMVFFTFVSNQKNVH